MTEQEWKIEKPVHAEARYEGGYRVRFESGRIIEVPYDVNNSDFVMAHTFFVSLQRQ